MNIVCISDLHGNLFKGRIPPCDMLLIAGDICPANWDWRSSIPLQSKWLKQKFVPWMIENKKLAKKIIFVPGNHDWIFEKSIKNVPSSFFEECIYLQNSSVEVNDLKIYGTPWQPPFCDWAFNRRERELEVLWEIIPEDVDILLLHGCPEGILDKTRDGVKIGSPSLTKKIKEIKPRFVIFGHNHNGYGVYKEDDITFVNASLLDEDYRMVNKPISIEI